MRAVIAEHLGDAQEVATNLRFSSQHNIMSYMPQASAFRTEDDLGHFGSVDRLSPIPLHHQVTRLLGQLIDDGSLSPDEPLPPEHQLAAHYGTSIAPVRQALLELTQAGLIYRVPGSGTFVHRPPVVEEVSHLTSFSESMRERGCSVEVKVLESELTALPGELGHRLETTNQQAQLLRRLAIVDGYPCAVLSSYLSVPRFQDLTASDLERGSLYGALAARYGVAPTRAETVIGVTRSNSELSDRLAIPVGTPLLAARGTTFDESDRAFECFELHYRPDRVELRFDSHRRPSCPDCA